MVPILLTYPDLTTMATSFKPHTKVVFKCSQWVHLFLTYHTPYLTALATAKKLTQKWFFKCSEFTHHIHFYAKVFTQHNMSGCLLVDTFVRINYGKYASFAWFMLKCQISVKSEFTAICTWVATTVKLLLPNLIL